MTPLEGRNTSTTLPRGKGGTHGINQRGHLSRGALTRPINAFISQANALTLISSIGLSLLPISPPMSTTPPTRERIPANPGKIRTPSLSHSPTQTRNIDTARQWRTPHPPLYSRPRGSSQNNGYTQMARTSKVNRAYLGAAVMHIPTSTTIYIDAARCTTMRAELVAIHLT